MTDKYIAPTGSDSASGSLADPWRTLARACRAGGQINLQPGWYPAALSKVTLPTTFTALGPVLISPPAIHGGWTEMQPGVWSIPYVCPASLGTACWSMSDNPFGIMTHRIPTFTASVPLFDTFEHWAATVLSSENKQTRWGIFATGTRLYLIPPFDQSFVDPNSVYIWASNGGSSLLVASNDVTVDSLQFIAADYAITVWSVQNFHSENLRFRSCHTGTGINAGVDPVSYGNNYLIEWCSFEDDGNHAVPGQPADCRQVLSWDAIKIPIDWGQKDAVGKPILAKANGKAESNALALIDGGAANVTIQDCTT